MVDIPALTLSGGRLESLSDAREFRVWVHPLDGDDFYHSSGDLNGLTDDEKAYELGKSMAWGLKQQGLKDSGVVAKVEKPLAVIFDAEKCRFREVVISDEIMQLGLVKRTLLTSRVADVLADSFVEVSEELADAVVKEVLAHGGK